MSPVFPTSFPQARDHSDEAASLLEAPLEEAAWSAVKETLRQRVSAYTYRTYVDAAQLASTGNGVVRLAYASQFLVDMVRDHYRVTFEEELLLVANRRIGVEFEVASEELPSASSVPPPLREAPRLAPTFELASQPRPVRPAVALEAVGSGEPPSSRRSANGLDGKYNFDAFVVGASNQFAYAACKAVADAPGKTYNPLFLWGGSGLGKTHLMQAVGNKAVADNPSAKVLYTSSEQFTNDLIGAIQNKKTPEFRRRYRECDILLIDDVQFLARKPATEEEFFHTFNALHSQGKQIIVTSDTAPHEIDDMEERLRSRFQWGLLADIQPPELETRVAILKSKAAAMRLPLADDVAQFLATHIRQNVRELEGSLLRIAAFANLMKGPLTVDVCKDVLKSLLVNKGQKVDCEQIIRTCGEYFKVTVADIKGPVRKRHIARARQASMFLCRKLTGASYPELGQRFGDKDHSTVINACQRVPQIMAEDPEFRRAVETLERELGLSM